MQTDNYRSLYNIGLTFEQALAKAGLRIADKNSERGYHTSVWVNHKLVRCYVQFLWSETWHEN